MRRRPATIALAVGSVLAAGAFYFGLTLRPLAAGACAIGAFIIGWVLLELSA